MTPTQLQACNDILAAMQNEPQPVIHEMVDYIADGIIADPLINDNEVAAACEVAGVMVSHAANDVCQTDGICRRKKTPPNA